MMVPDGARGAASSGVEVESERETEHGWSFVVRIRTEGGESRHDVTMSWVDYDYWCHGQMSPERVIRAVVEAVVSSGLPGGAPIPARFDASTARRWVRDMDERIAGRV